MNTPIFQYVLGKLSARVPPLTTVARETGIPYDTLKKIARGVTTNPGVLHVQTLYDYFQGQKDQSAADGPDDEPGEGADRRNLN